MSHIHVRGDQNCLNTCDEQRESMTTLFCKTAFLQVTCLLLVQNSIPQTNLYVNLYLNTTLIEYPCLNEYLHQEDNTTASLIDNQFN